MQAQTNHDQGSEWDRLTVVPDENRTVDRDRAAMEILGWRAEGLDLSAVEMAERGEYSAQHYRNVLGLYSNVFEDTDADDGREMVDVPVYGRGGEAVEEWIPVGVDVESYARGWVAGYLEGRDK